MHLINFLKENNISIVGRWIDQVLGTYSPQAMRVFKRHEDQFGNPVGYNVSQGLTEFYRAFCDEEDPAVSAAKLEQLIRIRAVQDFSPAEAVSFIFLLKRIVAEEYRKAKDVAFDPDEWLAFADRVDSVALLVFNLYIACRERLYQARISEIQSGRHILTDGAPCPSALLRASREKEESKE